MSEFEKQRRQKLLDEDFYPFVQERFEWEITEFKKQYKLLKILIWNQ